MIKNDELINKVLAVYANRRIQANDRCLSINESLDRDCEFCENHSRLKRVLFDLQKAEYDGETERINELKILRDELKKKRGELLAAKGLTEKDLLPEFVCKRCKDTGYLPQGGLCDCFYKTLTETINQALDIEPRELPKLKDYKAVSSFDEKLKTLITGYVQAFPSEKIRNLIFTGATGTGKTFAAGIIASSLIDRNYNVLFLTAVKANDVFLRYHTSGDGDRKAVFDLLTECDLLVLDDVGTEPVLKNVTVEYLTAFLSERLAHGKPFVITTNLSPEEIKRRYSERLLSRLSSKDSAFITFTGEDKRRTADKK